MEGSSERRYSDDPPSYFPVPRDFSDTLTYEYTHSAAEYAPHGEENSDDGSAASINSSQYEASTHVTEFEVPTPSVHERQWYFPPTGRSGFRLPRWARGNRWSLGDSWFGRAGRIRLPTESDFASQRWSPPTQRSSAFSRIPRPTLPQLPHLPQLHIVNLLAKYHLPRPISKRRNTLVCLCIFAIVFLSFLLWSSLYFVQAPLPGPTFADKVTDHSATFLTLNLFMRPPGIKNNDSDYKDSRLAYTLKYILPNYDVIAFQEAFAFGSKRKDWLIREARRQGFNYYVESPRRGFWSLRVDGGLLILSRFKIDKMGSMEFPRGLHGDWISAKGVLYARIMLNPSTPIDVFTTHSQASYGVTNDDGAGGHINMTDQTVMVRYAQIKFMRDFMLRQLSRSGEESTRQAPLLLLGDLNVDKRVHDPTRPINYNSSASSIEYKGMMRILTGDGVPDSIFDGENPQCKEDQLGTWFTSDQRLDGWKDVVHDSYGYHPITYGDVLIERTEEGHPDGDIVRINPREVVLTDHSDYLTVQSIDSILLLPPNQPSADQQQRIRTVRASVQPFFVAENSQLSKEERNAIVFTQVSDHYGISAQLELQ